MNELINKNYPIHFDRFELMRDSGSKAYVAVSGDEKYFLRVIKPAFYDTAVKAVEIQVFLQERGFPVPHVIFTKDSKPYIQDKQDGENYLYVLYEYIEGVESEPEQDAEAIGELLGQLHSTMKGYTPELIIRDKHFFIGRYIDILRKKQYGKIAEFEEYGNALWDKIKDLPRGYCHGDMYSGNIHKTPDGKLYILDFDTSCEGFPLYDLVLICNMTDYFNYDKEGYEKSGEIFARLLPKYQKHNSLNQKEIDAFYNLLALYHFALQATIIEINGIDCVDAEFLDKQLDWLYRWQEQCDKADRERNMNEYF